MGTFVSPLDPIFWLHHANIDRLWSDWSSRHPGQTPNDPRWLNFDLNQYTDLKGKPVTRKVSEMLTTQALGYHYDTQAALPMTLTMSAGPVAEQVAESLRTEVKVESAATFTSPLTVKLAMKPALRTRFMASPRVTRLPANAPALKQSLRLAIEEITPPKNPMRRDPGVHQPSPTPMPIRRLTAQRISEASPSTLPHGSSRGRGSSRRLSGIPGN